MTGRALTWTLVSGGSFLCASSWVISSAILGGGLFLLGVAAAFLAGFHLERRSL